MARAHFVKKAAKDHGAIKKGESYYWWAFMVGGRGGPKHYSKTAPKRSQLTQSEFLGTLYDIEDDISALAADDGLEDAVADIANRLAELADAQEEKKGNMPDSLQDSATGEQLQERADACRSASEELEQISFSDKPDEAEDRKGTDEADAQSEDEDGEDYWQGKLDEVQGVSIDAS